MKTDFIKSLVDKREYKYVELANQLRCLLVSDNETELSSASLDVHIGSLASPKEYQGLAHFCEHMLFLGTKKYPEESEYSNYIKNHGGNVNAFTGSKDTNYHFNVSNAAFEGALDRFSQFFKEPLFNYYKIKTISFAFSRSSYQLLPLNILPLFNADSTDRELKAVHSEFTKNIPSDFWRLRQLVCNNSHPDSAINCFSTGSLETLQKPEIRDELIKFHSKYYSSNIMTLVLLGKHSLSQLEAWANQYFGDITNKSVELPDLDYPVPFDSSRLAKIYKVVPVESRHMLKISWLLPDTRKMYKTKPSDLLAHLIGHEGPNSLLSYLLDEELALSLVASVESLEANTCFVYGDIELTEKGFAEWERVLEITCAYTNMLREKGPQKYIFDEQEKIYNLKFKYKNFPDVITQAVQFALHLHDYPKEIVHDLLQGPYTLHEYKEDEISKLVERLVPENMLVYFRSKTFEGQVDKEEKYYKAKYSIADIDSEMIKKLKVIKLGPSKRGKTLDLPPENIFVPKNIDLLPITPDLPKIPQLVKETEKSKIWYKQDHRFNVPKAYGLQYLQKNELFERSSKIAENFIYLILTQREIIIGLKLTTTCLDFLIKHIFYIIIILFYNIIIIILLYYYIIIMLLCSFAIILLDCTIFQTFN